jgi:glycosyltransferase involved in cell wall biosynthesis
MQGGQVKIGIYAHWNVAWDGREVRTIGCNARYLRHYLELVDGVRLFTTLDRYPRPYNSDWVCDPRLEVVPLPGGTFSTTWLKQRAVREVLGRHLDGLDAVYARLFDPCPWLLAPLCEARGIGLVYHLVGDAVQGIYQRRDWSRTGRLARRAIFGLEEYMVFRAARRHPLLINGSDLTRRFGHRHASAETVISSTLEEDDFFERDDTCQGETVTVLYTGMLRPAKRVETLIDAIAILVREGRSVGLRIVGTGDPPSHVDSLRARVRAAGLESRVEFVGHVPLGGPLNAECRAADIYVLPSFTEGSARTLLEAAANSLPCVTTDVGSARDLFAHEESALIIPPDEPEVMARSIARFIDERDLRRRCIRGAYQVARQHTCQEFIAHLVARLDEASRGARKPSPVLVG